MVGVPAVEIPLASACDLRMAGVVQLFRAACSAVPIKSVVALLAVLRLADEA